MTWDSLVRSLAFQIVGVRDHERGRLREIEYDSEEEPEEEERVVQNSSSGR